MTDQEQMISNNTNQIESLKEEVKSNAAFLREVQATIERQNRRHISLPVPLVDKLKTDNAEVKSRNRVDKAEVNSRNRRHASHH